MIIAVTGASGNMGEYVMRELVQVPGIDRIRILGHRKRSTARLLRKLGRKRRMVEIVRGSVASPEVCKALVRDADYVINMAAVIPPASDRHPGQAVEANETGAKVLVRAIEEMPVQAKLIHISTVALYGNRTWKHPAGTAGDPLLVSPYDIYALTKLRGEFAVLESQIKYRAVIRQTAMLYDRMLMKNISDGLMFHTCFNAPLEWATGRDSGVLIANIIRRDLAGELGEKDFWNRCFNLGMRRNRITGYESLDEGFRMIGGSLEDFFDPDYNSTRNFHGMWFSDGQELEKLFHYQKETTGNFWRHVLKAHPYYALGKLVPKKILRKVLIGRLLQDSNAPHYWKRHGDHARMLAYFGGEKGYDAIPEKWEDFPLTARGRTEDGPVDYEALRASDTLIDYGFDHTKPDGEITLSDLQNVAAMHGGCLLSKEFETGDVYRKLSWQTQDGEVFTARPYTVLRCGHWYHAGYEQNVWEFDRLSRKDRIFASVWLDSHDPEENIRYSFTEAFEAEAQEE